MKKLILLFAFTLLISCENSTNHIHDGSYVMNISMFGVNVNSKADVILNGNKIKINGTINDCKQYEEKIIVGNGNVVLNVSEGDLILDLPLGKVRYIRIGNATEL